MSEIAPLWIYEKGSSDYTHGKQDGAETSDLMTSTTSDHVVNRAFSCIHESAISDFVRFLNSLL